jgi:hypothetical protein
MSAESSADLRKMIVECERASAPKTEYLVQHSVMISIEEVREVLAASAA